MKGGRDGQSRWSFSLGRLSQGFGDFQVTVSRRQLCVDESDGGVREEVWLEIEI